MASEIPEFNEDDIFNRLQKLNVCKSPGPDMIHPRILHEIAQQIAYPLKLIFEISFVKRNYQLNGSTIGIGIRGPKCLNDGPTRWSEKFSDRFSRFDTIPAVTDSQPRRRIYYAEH